MNRTTIALLATLAVVMLAPFVIAGPNPVMVSPLMPSTSARAFTMQAPGSISLDDNVSIYWGDAADSSAYYDGSDLVINAAAVGSGRVNFETEHTSHGQKYVSTAGTVAIGVQNTWYKLDSAGIVWSGNDMTDLALTTEAIVIGAGWGGDYKADWCVSGQAASGTPATFMVTVFSDTDADPAAGATNMPGCEADRDVSGTARVNWCGTCIVDVSAAEYVYIGIRNTAGTTDFEVEHASLVLVQL